MLFLIYDCSIECIRKRIQARAIMIAVGKMRVTLVLSVKGAIDLYPVSPSV
jgi:hypothetical protein